MGPQGEKGLAPRKHLDGPMPPFQIGWGAQGQVLQQSSVPVRTSEQLPRPPHLTSARSIMTETQRTPQSAPLLDKCLEEHCLKCSPHPF